MFNAGLAVVFLPLLGPLVRFVQTILPASPEREEAFGPKYLDRSALDTPALAFAQAKREKIRIGVIALVAELIPMIKLVRMDPCAIVMEE